MKGAENIYRVFPFKMAKKRPLERYFKDNNEFERERAF
jgi:hypothetical protein